MIGFLIALALLQNIGLGGPLDGVYSNEEEVYFGKEANQATAPWVSIKVVGDRVFALDAYGNNLPTSVGHIKGDIIENCSIFPSATGNCTFSTLRDAAGFYNLNLTSPDGEVAHLRLAREFRCWSAIPKRTPKAEGTVDWFFVNDLKIHDQGGMVKIGDPHETGTWHLKIRNVAWPTGPNQPSLVLYVYEDTNLNSAISYSWADPSAVRIGINLRRIQASCKLVI